MTDTATTDPSPRADLGITDALVVDDTGAVRSVDIYVRDGSVASISDAGRGRVSARKVVHAAGGLTLPGFVNSHSHSYGPLCRHEGMNLPLEPWMMHAWATTAGRTREEVRLSAQLQAVEALRTGTTGMLDHLGGAIEDQEAALDAYEEIGIRALVAPMIADIRLPDTVGAAASVWPASARAGDPALDQRSTRDLIDATVALHDGWTSPSGRTGVMFGPSAPQRCSDEMMREIADISRSRGIRVHTHLLESRVQAGITPPKGFGSWLELLDEQGLLSARLSAAHGVWVSPADIELAAGRAATFVHNPQSNLQLGSGVADLTEWRRQGLSVALGTDGVNCGGSMDMVSSMRFATVLHRPSRHDPSTWETPLSALRLATAGAAALGFGSGRLEVGEPADFSIFPTDTPAYASGEDPLATLVLGAWDHSARTVVVAGRVVVDDGRLTTIDETALLASAREVRAKLLARNSHLAELARAQEPFLTELTRTAKANRSIMPFTGV
jgi:guanine deaminase